LPIDNFSVTALDKVVTEVLFSTNSDTFKFADFANEKYRVTSDKNSVDFAEKENEESYQIEHSPGLHRSQFYKTKM
jgi:hypothetical protein